MKGEAIIWDFCYIISIVCYSCTTLNGGSEVSGGVTPVLYLHIGLAWSWQATTFKSPLVPALVTMYSMRA